MKARKILFAAIIIVLSLALTSQAYDASKQKALGQDKNKMTWYILDYGKDSNGVPFAVSRKYYTNATLKNETIELLMAKFGLAPEIAGSLYFTEYGYEYTPDGKQFAITFIRHYNILGDELHKSVYNDKMKMFVGIPAGSTPAIAGKYALNSPVTQSTRQEILDKIKDKAIDAALKYVIKVLLENTLLIP